MMKRVLVITVRSLKNDNRVINEADALAESGLHVDLISLDDNIVDQSSTQHQFNSIKLNLIFEKWQAFYPAKILKYSEFILRVLHFTRNRKHDIIHAHDLDGLFVAKLVQMLSSSKMKIVYDAHEYETESNGLYGIKKKIKQITEKSFIKDIDGFITVSDSIASEYQRLYGIKNATIILNTPKYSGDNNIKGYNHFRNEMGIRDDQRIFLYQGYLMDGRGVELLVQSFLSMVDDINVIVFMGSGRLSEYVKDNALNSNVIYHHDFVPGDLLIEYTSSADVGISFIEDISLSDRYCLPNKMFEYMSAGLPVITSNLPEMRRFVQDNKIGLVADVNTVDGFTELVYKLNNDNIRIFKDNALKTSKLVNWNAQKVKLIDLYASL